MIRSAVSRLVRPSLLLGGAKPAATSAAAAAARGYAQSGAAQENRRRRIELAATYRAMEHCNLHEGVCNHITALAPAADNSGRELMLLVPEGLYWSQVTPSCLLGLDENEEVVEGDGTPERTALCIHRGVRRKHNHLAVVHAHSPYTTALACLADKTVRPIHQSNIAFVNRIAYDSDFGGFGVDDEGARLGEAIGDKDVLMMGGHGYVTCGDTVAMAFNRAYYLERVAMFQVLAMSTGQSLCEITPEILAKSQGFLNTYEAYYAQRHLNSFIGMFAQTSSEYSDYDVTPSSQVK